MPLTQTTVTCPVHNSFRVQQVAGMFDVALADRLTEHFSAEVPDANQPWQIGLIVGPSGSGKSTIARHVFGDSVYTEQNWPNDRAVIDCIGDLSIQQITSMFTAVGFSSPPSWIKPYQILSRGEQFRCDLVRALAAGMSDAMKNPKSESRNSKQTQNPNEQDKTPATPHRYTPQSPSTFEIPCSIFDIPTPPLVVFDEFTSVVDRNVARIGSAAVATAIRRQRIPVRFVAVTCHYDVSDWLAPDWILDMATGECQWRCLRRPPIRLRLFRTRHAAWRLFARHHYLSGSLSTSARCFVAMLDEAPVCFCATLPIIGRRNHWRITRIVTLPDYQGVGIGMRVAAAVAELHHSEGHRLNITASNPALLAHCRRSPDWRAVGLRKTGSPRARSTIRNYRGSLGRAVASFEYTGQ